MVFYQLCMLIVYIRQFKLQQNYNKITMKLQPNYNSTTIKLNSIGVCIEVKK